MKNLKNGTRPRRTLKNVASTGTAGVDSLPGRATDPRPPGYSRTGRPSGRLALSRVEPTPHPNSPERGAGGDYGPPPPADSRPLSVRVAPAATRPPRRRPPRSSRVCERAEWPESRRQRFRRRESAEGRG